jgi:hypothetical protein
MEMGMKEWSFWLVDDNALVVFEEVYLESVLEISIQMIRICWKCRALLLNEKKVRKDSSINKICEQKMEK